MRPARVSGAMVFLIYRITAEHTGIRVHTSWLEANFTRRNDVIALAMDHLSAIIDTDETREYLFVAALADTGPNPVSLHSLPGRATRRHANGLLN